MKKRASLSLSVNAIVVLILAIVMLGLGLGFIRGMFGKVSTQVETQIATEPEPHIPTSANMITLSREMIITHAGEQEVMKTSIFNPTNNTWDSKRPGIACGGSFLVSSSSNPKTIAQGEFETFDLLLDIPGDSPPDTHLCQLGINLTDSPGFDYQKDMTIKIIE